MNESIGEFRGRITSRAGSKGKFRNSYGVYDYFKYYRKTRPREKKYVLNEKQFYSLIRKTNKLLAESIIRGDIVQLPMGLGEFYTKRDKTYVDIVNGKIKTNKRIDWNETLKLWHSDKEAYDKRVFIRRDDPYRDTLRFSKKKFHYKNKLYFEFRVTKDLLAKYSKERAHSNVGAIFSSIQDAENINGLYNG